MLYDIPLLSWLAIQVMSLPSGVACGRMRHMLLTSGSHHKENLASSCGRSRGVKDG